MKYCLDGRNMVSREEAHGYLREVFGFPPYYGKNLDALSDCLSELGAAEVELLHTEEMKEVLGAYGTRLLRVFREAENITLEEK